jgi:hypothetical protein
MTSRKLLALTGVVIALFAFIFFFERKMPTTSEREQKGDLYWDLPADRVESIRLEHGGEIVELAKSGESWKLVKPESYPADTVTASDLASQLAGLKKPPGESQAEGNPEGYGLVKPAAKATFAWSDSKKPGQKSSRTLEFGLDIPGTDLTAARVAGKPEILFVPASVAASVRKAADDFKSKDVFGGASLDATGIDVARGRGRLVLAKKNGIWWIEQPISDLADREVADRLASDLSALRVTEFVPKAQATELPSLGLSPPSFRVTITDSKGGRNVLDLGSTRSDGNSAYASRQGQVFTVANSTVDELSKEATAFRDKRLVRFERSDVSGIENAIGPVRRSFTRNQAGWSIDGRALLASAADDLMTALSDVESKSFVDDAAAQTLSERPAEWTISLKMARGPGWTVKLSPFRGDFGVTVSGRPGAFVVAKDAAERLREAIEKAATPPVTPVPTPAASK